MKMKRALYLILSLALMISFLVLPVMAAGINVNVQTKHEVVQGEELILYCGASSDSGAELSYIWYETATGKLEDMFAINRGTETFHTYVCDTSEVGTRYYLCSVSDGTAARYSDIITVRVMSDNGTISVVFTSDSEPVTGGHMTVDIEKMQNDDSGLYNAYLEGQIGYEWYRDGQKVSNTTGTMNFTDADAGCSFYVVVKGYNITLKSDEFRIENLIVPPEIKTTKLADATVGEPYAEQIKCYDDVNAEYIVYYNPGKANDFEKTGLTLKDDGKISGTPKTAGSYTFTVCAANEGGEDYATYTLVVKEATTDPTETTVGVTDPSGSTPAAGEPAKPGEDKTTTGTESQHEMVETTGSSGASRLGGSIFMVVAIIAVITLAVLAAVAAIVVTVILIVRKRKG